MNGNVKMSINGLTMLLILSIIYLTREPLASVHLTARKISVIKNSALLYQSRGAIFYVFAPAQFSRSRTG